MAHDAAAFADLLWPPRVCRGLTMLKPCGRLLAREAYRRHGRATGARAPLPLALPRAQGLNLPSASVQSCQSRDAQKYHLGR